VIVGAKVHSYVLAMDALIAMCGTEWTKYDYIAKE